MVTWHWVGVPVTAVHPVNPAKLLVVAASASRVTTVPCVKDVAVVTTPFTFLLTEPAPVPDIVTLRL